MKKRIGTLTVLLLCVGIFAQDMISTSKVIYDYNSPYYTDLYLSCMENGTAMLSYKKPLSVSEVVLNYKQIDSDNLSEQGLRLYNNLKNLLYEKKPEIFKDKFAFDYNLTLALEAMFLHNKDNEPRIDKIYRYNNSREAIKLSLEFYLSKFVYAYFIPTLGKNFSGFNLSYPYTNLPLTQKALDYHFPKNAGFAIGNSFFNIHIGRGRLTVGKTIGGSMLISDSLDRMDFLSTSIFFKTLKLDLTVAELSPTSFFINHSINVRPVKQLSFTIHEGIMLGSVFDPKFLNPLMIFHNYGAWKQPYANNSDGSKLIGCQLGLDINIVPIKNLRIYGQFGMNQFQTPSELKSGATDIPNSMGGIAGIEYVLPILSGHFILTGEFMYADPWLYIGKAGITGSFHTYRKEMVYIGEDYHDSRIDYWLANPYGPDTIAAFVKAEFISTKKYGINFMYRFLVKGQNEKLFIENAIAGTDYYPSKTTPKSEGIKMAQYKTPSGKVTFFNTIKLSGNYNILKNLSLNANFSWTITGGAINGHLLDFSTGIGYSLK